MIFVVFAVVVLVILIVAGLIADGSEREDAWSDAKRRNEHWRLP